MPASRNDITRKAQYVTTSRKNKYRAHDKEGGTHIIWADNLAEADKHAVSKGWILPLGERNGKIN